MPTLDFKGKPFVYSHHLSVPFRELVVDSEKSLVPKGEEPSLDDNLIIHGDNLEALKALLPRYAGKVDVIYIDPPYNTGNEGWAYNDAVNSPLMKEWLGKVVDKEDLERHDKWLCMMWPRLTLLKELLAEGGAIFVSIDNNELRHLITIGEEIFGHDHVGTIPVVSNMKGRNDRANIASCHDYIVVFDKGGFVSKGLPLTEKQIAVYNQTDDRGERFALRDLRKRGGPDTRADRPNLFYPIYCSPDREKLSLKKQKKDWLEILPMKSDGVEGRWRWASERTERLLHMLVVTKGRGADKLGVAYRVYLNPDAAPEMEAALDEEDEWDDENDEPIERTAKSKSFWWGPELSTDRATKQLKEIMNGGGPKFEYPKPLALLRRIVHMASHENSIILDSFAGSGTTAHAVLAANKADGGNRRFVLVECEKYADTLTAERVRRAASGVKTAKTDELQMSLGGSFTFCNLGDAIDLERFFSGKTTPDWEQVARYVAYTATGQTFAKAPKKPGKDWFVGEAGGYRIHLIYEADVEFMRSNKAALDMGTAERISKCAEGKPVLVYAAAKFMGQKDLSSLGITFCQLPYAIHRILGDGPNEA